MRCLAHKWTNKGKPGFTLVELLVVMAVLVMASVAVVPAFARFQRQSQRASAARRTMDLAVEARGLAISRDTEAALIYDPHAHALRLEVEPTEVDAEAEQGSVDSMPAGERRSPDGRRLEYPVEVRVTMEGPDGNPALRFYGDGRADAATIRFEREGLDPLLLAVNPRTGRLFFKEEQP